MPLHKKRNVDTMQIGLFTTTVNASSPHDWWSQHAERHCGLYAITHRASGRFYIGSSSHIFRRWANHRYALIKGTHSNAHLQRAWTKYGAEAFLFHILVEVDATHSLTDLEQEWLDAYAGQWLYNLSERADRPTKPDGWTFSAETRAKMRLSHLGKSNGPRSEETKEKIRQAHLGVPQSAAHRESNRQARLGKSRGPLSEATKEKIRQARLAGSPISEETRLKMQLAHAGKPGRPQSGETKEKLRQAHLGKPKSPAHIEASRQARLGKPGKPHSEETKEKLRQIRLANPTLTEETRNTQRLAVKGKKLTPARISAIRAGMEKAREKRMVLPTSPDTGYLSI